MMPLVKWLLLVTTFLYSSMSFAIAEERRDLPEIKFTPQEISYLNNKASLSVCIDPQWMPFEMNDNGKYVGLTADYMALFESLIGKPIHLFSTKTWLESVEASKSKQCDFLSAVAETPQRREYLEFTDPYFHSSLVIATGLHQPWINNIDDISGNKIGVVKGYASAEFIENNYPDIVITEVESLKQGLELVAKGKLFGMVEMLATVGYQIQQEYIGSLKISGKLDRKWDISVGVNKDQPLLTSIFNKAINAIPMEEHQRVLNNWVSVSVNHDDPNMLSDAELDFIRKHPVIRFRTRSNRPPFEFVQDGKVAGLAIDYISLIAEQTGFKAEFVLDDRPQPDAFNEMEVDVNAFDTLLYSVKNQQRAERFSFGDAFLSYPVMIVVNKNLGYIGGINDLFGRNVAMEKGFVTTNWFKRDYPLIDLVETANTVQALRMVDSGNSDAYIGNLAIANYMKATGALENIKIAAPTEYANVDYRFIAPKKWPELTSILNKGFRSISPHQHSLIQQNWFSLQTIDKTNYGLTWAILIGALTVIGGFIISHRKISKAKRKLDWLLIELTETKRSLEVKNQQLQKLSITDRLTGLYNRLKLEEVLAKEFHRSFRYNEVYSIMMIDIDHFKRVNDTYGHQVGDVVLQEMSLLFLNNIRKVDTIGRWGGEEFLVICPHTDSDSAEKFAEILRAQVEKTHFKQVENLTISFGVASYQPQDTIESMVSRADEALYEAKSLGRNRVVAKK